MSELQVSTGLPGRLAQQNLFVEMSNGTTASAIGNYAAAPEEFVYAPAGRQVAYIYRMIIFVQDGGTFDSGDYGNGITLTNGIKIEIKDADGTIMDLTDGHPIVVNPDWARLCYDVRVDSYGSGDQAMSVRWTFSNSGAPIRLDAGKGQYLAVVLNDNFSALIDQRFSIQGGVY